MVLGSSNDTVKLHGIADEPWHGIVLDSMQYGMVINTNVMNSIVIL